MNNIYDIVTSIVFGVLFLVFVFYTRRTSTFRSFAVSDNSMGFLLLFFSFSATFIGPGFSMALVSQGFSTGWFYLCVAGFYGIAKIIEGSFLAPRIRSQFSEAMSIGDIIAGKESHNNKWLHLLTGIVSLGLVIGFSTVLSKAGGEVMNNFFGISKPLGMVIMTSIVVLYSFFGGIKATILTDAVQFILFTVLMLVLFVLLFFHGTDIGEVSKETINISLVNIKSTSISQYFALISAWLFGEMLIPPTINRILSAKTKMISKKGLVCSGIFMIIWLFIMLSIGSMARSILPNSEGTEQLLLTIANQKLTFGLFGLFAVAIIGIVMSSQDSLINSSSIIFTNDIVAVFKNIGDKEKLLLARMSTLVVGVFSVVFALFMPSILEGLLLIYSLWAPAILIPLITSIYVKEKYGSAAIVAMISGIMTSLIWRHLAVNEHVPAIFVGMTISALSYWLVYSIKKIRT